jgi:porin
MRASTKRKPVRQTNERQYDRRHNICATTIQWSVGLPIVEGVLTTNSYQARNGLRGNRLRAIYWYQPIWHGKVELEAGLLPNTSDYIGTNVGGSLAGGALGPQASITVETGISYAQYNAPTLSAKVNWTKQLYTRTAIQRSISPQGSAVEAASNPTGLAFVSPGGKPLFIQEIGYRTAPTADTLSTWVRGGFLYNTSRYRLLNHPGTSHNHAFYAAIDHQLTQPDAQEPGRGLYAGATTDLAPASVDTISRYFRSAPLFQGALRIAPA